MDAFSISILIGVVVAMVVIITVARHQWMKENKK
tara:strand:+ start:38 stop:139 length:102 start_codon:yes stop_codon:yes gene_type:complete